MICQWRTVQESKTGTHVVDSRLSCSSCGLGWDSYLTLAHVGLRVRLRPGIENTCSILPFMCVKLHIFTL